MLLPTLPMILLPHHGRLLLLPPLLLPLLQEQYCILSFPMPTPTLALTLLPPPTRRLPPVLASQGTLREPLATGSQRMPA